MIVTKANVHFHLNGKYIAEVILAIDPNMKTVQILKAAREKAIKTEKYFSVAAQKPNVLATPKIHRIWHENVKISPETIYTHFKNEFEENKKEDIFRLDFSAHFRPEEQQIAFYSEAGNFLISEVYDEETEQNICTVFCYDENDTEEKFYLFLINQHVL